MIDKTNHISFRPSKKSPTIKQDLQDIGKKKSRSLNWLIEQILLTYIKKNKK